MKRKSKTLRSALYLPASNARAIEKAESLEADAIIFDLEDAVSVEHKAQARDAACAAVANGKAGSSISIIRINGLDTPWGKDDFEAALISKPDAILVPKINIAGDVQKIANRMSDVTTVLWVMIETAQSVLDVQSIATASPKLECLVLGTNDLAKETRMSMDMQREALMPSLTQCVIAGRAAGIHILDGVFNDFKNADDFLLECQQGKRFGMDGKTLIHPSQIDPCNSVFSPSLDDLQKAQRIVEVFEQPENHSANVVSIDGQMVERLHAEMAKEELERGKAIGLI